MSRTNFVRNVLGGSSVEWRTLADVTLPIGNIKWRDTDRSYRYIDLTSVSIETKAIGDTPEITAANAPSRAQKLVEEGDVIFATTRPVQQRYCFIREEYAGCVASTGYCVLRADREVVLPKWILHWIASTSFRAYVEENQSGSAYPAISDARVKEFRVPIPCPEDARKSLEIQAKIVRILDAFTELKAALTAELTARQRQYNHYREKLLRFEGGNAEWKTLGEIGTFIRGKRFTKADFADQGIDAIHYGEIYTRYGVWTEHAVSKVRPDMEASLRYAKPNDVVLTGVGETVEDVGKAVAWIGSGNVAIHDDSFAFRHSMNSKYVAYAMQTAAFIDEKAKHVSRGKVNRLLVDGLAKVRIPIPYPNDPEKSLAEQARIVAILDKFDALTHSLTEGLPREIELRQKQYEHYRDLLLSLPKPHEAAV